MAVKYFNSHPHEEDDDSPSQHLTIHQYFNSHPHEEDDIYPVKYACNLQYFNSHPHEEDDQPKGNCSHLSDISTHILTKRMTSRKGFPCFQEIISTHILTKRMTVSDGKKAVKRTFQLTSSRRG